MNGNVIICFSSVEIYHDITLLMSEVGNPSIHLLSLV